MIFKKILSIKLIRKLDNHKILIKLVKNLKILDPISLARIIYCAE